jgi:hypothetical protein
MSDDTKRQDEELDNVSGGALTHPMPRDPIRPPGPPTHPGGGVNAPIEKRNPSNPGT